MIANSLPCIVCLFISSLQLVSEIIVIRGSNSRYFSPDYVSHPNDAFV